MSVPISLTNTVDIVATNFSIDNGSNIVDLDNVYASINYVDNAIVGAGGISQTDVDDAIAPLITKDIAHDTAIQANVDAITILNTKQIQNFSSITDINTNLTNNYQTNSQLTTNFYNKTEVDTTLGNYYTSAVIDAGFYNQTYINNNIYTKTEVDGLIAGAGGNDGYTDTQIDNFLSLKEDKSTFTDKK